MKYCVPYYLFGFSQHDRSHLLPLNSSCASWNDSKLCNPLPPGYTDGLLLKAVDLADRLMPAFDTPSGIPLSWVNLRKVLMAYLYPLLLNARPISSHYQLQNIDGLGLGLCTEELPVHIHLFRMGECEFIDEVLGNLILSKHQSQPCFHHHFLLPGGVSSCAVHRAFRAVKILTVITSPYQN